MEIDLKKWSIRNGKQPAADHAISEFPPTVMHILEESGILNLLKKRADAELAG